MADTATKQRIKGDLADRVDELEKELEKYADSVKVCMNTCKDAMAEYLVTLEARIDKLEKDYDTSMEQIAAKVTGIPHQFDCVAELGRRLASRIAVLEQASGMDIERCIAGGEQVLNEPSLGPTGAQLAWKGIIKDEANHD